MYVHAYVHHTYVHIYTYIYVHIFSNTIPNIYAMNHIVCNLASKLEWGGGKKSTFLGCAGVCRFCLLPEIMEAFFQLRVPTVDPTSVILAN